MQTSPKNGSVNSTASLLASTLGWVGAAGTFGAYALVSRGALDVKSLRFQLTNVVGAACLAMSAVVHDNWPSAVSNVLWMVCGVPAVLAGRHAVARILRSKVRPLSARGVAPVDIVDRAPTELEPRDARWDDTGTTMAAISG